MNIGIDIVNITRIPNDITIAKKILSKNEFNKYQSFNYNVRKKNFLAGRLAAKEAIFKCISTKKIIDINQIHIKIKQPTIIILKKIKYYFQLSISHEKKYVIAVALLIKKTSKKI